MLATSINPFTPQQNILLMKFKFIYMIFFLGISVVLFTSSKNGRAGAANWGNTGAPGDEVFQGAARVCQSCHNSAAIQITQSFEMTNGQGEIVTGEYTPGATYTVTITNNVVSGNAEKYGFQMLCLNAPEGTTGAEVSNWTAVSSNVQIATASNTGRTYAEHFQPSDENTFQMTWVAPVEGSGEVTFYYVGVGTNDNNQINGDGGSTNAISFTEGEVSSIRDLTLNVEMNAFPNPVQDVLNLKVSAAESGKYQLRLVDLTGKILSNEFVNLMVGDNQLEVEMAHMPTAAYTVQLLKDGKLASQQLLKK